MLNQMKSTEKYFRLCRFSNPSAMLSEIFLQTRNTFCRTRSLSNVTFSFLITWRSSSSKSAAVYKISWKSDDFFYWDMAIYRFSKWRPSAILKLFYHHTRPHTKSLLPQLPVKFHVNLIHRSDDIVVWIFRIFGLKCLFRLQNRGFGGLLTSKCDYLS